MADSREVSISSASISDQASSQDSLGFEPYVIAIADFLTEPETKPPLTLSVEGEWGSGKSSFMKQLEQEVVRKSKERIRDEFKKQRKKHIQKIKVLGYKLWKRLTRLLDRFTRNIDGLWKEFIHKFTQILKGFELRFLVKLLLNLPKLFINLLIVIAIPLVGMPLVTLLFLIEALVNLWKIVKLTFQIWFPPKPRMIWFNAWRHDKADALWAAFALTFLEEISSKRHFLDIFPPLLGHLKLFWCRFQRREGWLDLLRTFLQGSLTFSAIFLIALFTFAPGNPWIKSLSDQVQQYANSLIASSPGASSSPNPTPSTSPTPVSSPTPSPTPTPDSSGSSNNNSSGNSSNKIDFLIKLPFWGAGSLAILTLWKHLQKIVGDPKKDLKEYLKSPKYDDHVSFIEKFHEDFKKIVDAYAGKGKKVYVFIDDLDRCEVPKSAELMQAINLMISNDPQLIFILGMDREKVAAGLAVKHKDVIPYLASGTTGAQAQSSQTQNYQSLKGIEYGYTFIEKFVQLPFQVPRPTEDQFQQFLSRLSSPEQFTNQTRWLALWNFFWKPIHNNVQRLNRWISPEQSEPHKRSEAGGGTENPPDEPAEQTQVEQRLETVKIKTGPDSEEIQIILKMVAPALDWNPRRIKQFLNLFRLRAYIAAATGLFDQIGDSPALTLEQLAKFTAIGVKWPLLMVDLEQDEQLLAKLQKGISSFPKVDGTKIYWGNEPQLLELLSYKASEPGYSLEQVRVNKLLQVSPRVHPLDRIPLNSEKGVDYRKLRDYLREGRWREADRETFEVMLKAADRTDQGYLNPDDLENFPCQDLQTIDKLWVAASKGQFGFSVQKRIWQECGSPMEYNDNWEKFGNRVGWRRDGEWLFYGDINPSLSSPRGIFPELLWLIGLVGWWEWVFSSLARTDFLSRTDL